MARFTTTITADVSAVDLELLVSRARTPRPTGRSLGGNSRRLTSDDAADRLPAWSPDGKLIAFESDRGGEFKIYVMKADGSEQHRVSSQPGADGHPAWSPDGKHIVFHKTVLGHGQVYVMDSDGSNTRRLTPLSSVAFSGFPTWARSGDESGRRVVATMIAAALPRFRRKPSARWKGSFSDETCGLPQAQVTAHDTHR
jgi:Tol biopolymer transport system component